MPGKIGDRIAVLKQELGISSNRALEKGGLPDDEWLISNGLLATWEEVAIDDFTSNKLEKFLNHYKVNRAWWRTGKGDILIKNGTPVEKTTDDNEKADPSINEAIRNLLEGNTDYILIHKVVILEKYRLVSIEEMEKADKELERKQDQISKLHELLKQTLDKLPGAVHPVEVQKAQ